MRAIVLLVSVTACGSSTAAIEDLARSGAACSTAEDCCVVMDDCHRLAYVVGAGDFEEARDLARAASREDPACNRFCELPTVDLQCVQGRCAGVVAGASMPNLRTDHCGSALLDVAADRDDQILQCVPITEEHRP